MHRCSPSAISVGGLMPCCKELEGDDDTGRSLLTAMMCEISFVGGFPDGLGKLFALTAALSSSGESGRMAVGDVAETRVVLKCYHGGHRATTTVPSTNPSPRTFCAHTLAMGRKVHAVLTLGGADERYSW
ncbi:hypothetical protein M422DRAFT_260701 [Sphaerobolus stellatus SS14]|uniref:Uncharacterized protein n=1 Tax=Sphaerobolus stellatus (strain SS14) TaxID=990650 RepID=A0A0C9VHP4_SPHS4|nr:hypothetical protein M422DRAFT_260701 [Sphaerobolus stellatus SS14]